MILYQFPISHYCELARWSLDYKSLSYKLENLVPILHVWTTRRLAKKTYVPLLVDEKKIVQGSNHIIDYLDRAYPENCLTPSDSLLKKESAEVEKYLSEMIGVTLRCYFYHTLLNYPSIIFDLLLQGIDRKGKVFFKTGFPLIKRLMRLGMNINAQTAKESQKNLEEAFDYLDKKLSSNSFLVGNKLSRVDLSAASLLAPLVMPAEHSLKWPHDIPSPLKEFRQKHQNRIFFRWVEGLYKNYR